MYIVYLFVAALMGIGIYAVVMKDNILKKVIGLGIIGHGVHVLLVNIGHVEGGLIPIITSENIAYLGMHSVDPIPQALVLTSIVIDFGITVLALSIIVMIYKHIHSLSSKDVGKMKG
ncbi:MAG: cation:proton antiporter subunit C [Candidatus Aenigmarchaeota archaeon]|nr:cation:proton antiporter subunit C [Candidatus Aenigmarchaeota archaeon]